MRDMPDLCISPLILRYNRPMLELPEMDLRDIAHARLFNLQLSQTSLSTPSRMVAWLGAMQAQDYAGAKWSLGLRLRPTSDETIEAALDRGDILRTHMLRPTWHFVAPEDIRWMQALTAPRVHKINSTMYRQLELDDVTLTRCATVLSRALRSGNRMTRNEIKMVLEADDIRVAGGRDRSGQRLAYIVMWAELEQLLCSGPRRGKQFTYMLLEERAPNARIMLHEEALAELTRRYFTSHGPATLHDFARWSSLTLADVRQGLEAAGSELNHEEVQGQTHWFAGDALSPAEASPTAYLLSIYDEYIIGYKDRSAIGEPEYGERLRAMGNALQNVIILDGQIVGTFRRTAGKEALAIELNLFKPLTPAESAAVAESAKGYGAFFGLPLKIGLRDFGSP